MMTPELLYAYRYWKWRALGGFCVFYCVNYLGRFNFSLIQPRVIEDLGITAADTGFINSCMFWGFALGDLVHGRLGERFGYRRVVLAGALGTGLFNVVASFGDDMASLAIPWAVVGFVNAATWAPGIGLLAQWWSRRERGRALGWVLTAAGIALLVVWIVSPAVAAAWGWRAALRYPPLLISVLGLAFWFVARDRPADVGLPPYSEEDEVSRDAESAAEGRAHGLTALSAPPLRLALLRRLPSEGARQRGALRIVSWAPVYYVLVGGFDLATMAWITFAYPVGYLFAPVVGGWISDRVFRSNRSIVVAIAGAASGVLMLAIAFSPADNVVLAVVLLALGGFTVNLSPVAALAVGPRGAAPRGHRLRGARRPRLRLRGATGVAVRLAGGREPRRLVLGLRGDGVHPASSPWPRSGGFAPEGSAGLGGAAGGAVAARPMGPGSGGLGLAPERPRPEGSAKRSFRRCT